MSSGSNPPSSTINRSSSRFSGFRSIRDVISSLRTSFRDADFREAERELVSREATLRREKEKIEDDLREKCDKLEAEHRGLRLEVVQLEGERQKLERECEINDDKLKDLESDLRVAKEREERANKRYGDLVNRVEEMERKKEELLEKLQREQSGYAETLTELRNEVDDLRRNLREKEEEINGLVRKNDELLEIQQREAEAVAQLEELRRINSEKDARIEELVKKNEVLEMEKMEVLKENEGLRAEKEAEAVRNDQIEKQVSKLESSVAAWMCNVGKDGNFANALVREAVSAFIMVLDSNGSDVCSDSQAKKDENLQDVGLVVVSPVSEPRRCLKFDPAEVDIIDIESGSDDETLADHKLKKRNLSKRGDDHDGLGDDSLNLKHKLKKLNDLPNHPVKRKQSISGGSGNKSDQKLATPPSVRKCSEKLKEAGNSEDEGRSTEADAIWSPKVKELFDTCRRSKSNNVLAK